MAWNRREFLKASAILGATTTAGLDVLVPVESQAQVVDVDAWHKAPCRFCGTGCGVLVGVKRKRIVAVKGDPESRSIADYSASRDTRCPRSSMARTA